MDVDAALASQIRNIESTYGQPVSHWFTVIDSSTLTKHSEVVAMLKGDHGLAHGAAHRLALLWRSRDSASPADIHTAEDDPVAALYSGTKSQLRPLLDAVMTEIGRLGHVDVAPKKGYLSLRRRKQFAMLQPSTTGRLDLGLILPAGTPVTDRLESSAKFNALFTHRVRLVSTRDVDAELKRWLTAAYAHAE